MDRRKLAIKRIRYLWKLRNKSPAHRRQLRHFLMDLQWRKITRSKRLWLEAMTAKRAKAAATWATIERLCFGSH